MTSFGSAEPTWSADATIRDIRSAPSAGTEPLRVRSGSPDFRVTGHAEVGQTRIDRALNPPTVRRLVLRLRDRKLFQWMAAYAAMGWIVLQSTQVLAEIWGWSALFQQVVSLLLGLGVLPALVVAWFHGEKGRQEVCRLEAALMAACVMGAVVAVWSFCFGVRG